MEGQSLENKSIFTKRNYIFSLLLAVTFVVFSIWFSNNRSPKVFNEYIPIQEIKKFEGIIDDFFIYRGNVQLVSGKSKIYIKNSRNLILEPKQFCYFIKKGDVLYKKQDSKIINIRRKEFIFSFKVGEYYYEDDPIKIAPN